MAAGETEDQILEAHPRLPREGIRASLAFAAEALNIAATIEARGAFV